MRLASWTEPPFHVISRARKNKTYEMSWKAKRVVREMSPLTRLVPFTIPANVLPNATLISQSKRVTGATQRLDERRK